MLAGFRRFRHGRPFWGGLFVIAGGVEILLLPISPIADLVLLGVAGVSGALIGVVLVVLGLFIWLSPPNRTLAGVLSLVFALASFVVSNLGGLIVGMVLGLVGGALALAWTPDRAAARAPRGSARDPDDDGPPTMPIMGVLVVVALLPGLLFVGGGRAGALPLPTPPPAPPPPALPGPLSPNAGSPLAGSPPAGSPLAGSPIPRPPVPGSLLPGLLPPLPLSLPPQPRVAPAGDVRASGLVGELLMDTLTVTNFRYRGIVEYPVDGGGRQRALHIIVDSTDIGNLRINIPGEDGSVQVVQRPGSAHATTTRLILDCTRIRLTAFGLLPLEFSLEFPPPPNVLIPFLSATRVEIDYVRLATPKLVIPGLSAQPDERPGGKRVGVVGGPASRDPAGMPAAGARLTPEQTTQLTRLAARLRQPELLRPYQQGRV